MHTLSFKSKKKKINPPPLILAMQKTPPKCLQNSSLDKSNSANSETLKPPYPYSMHGFLPFIFISFKKMLN